MSRRLIPKNEHGEVQQQAQSLLEQALQRHLPGKRRARALLGWWLRNPLGSLGRRGAYTETITLYLGPSARDIAAGVLDRGRSIRDLEEEPRGEVKKIVARATSRGRAALYAVLDDQGPVGAGWHLQPHQPTTEPRLQPLFPGSSLERESDDLGGPPDDPEDPVTPTRWEIQHGTEGRR